MRWTEDLTMESRRIQDKLRIVQRGCELKALYDEAVIFRACDPTFSNGRIGVWTKADAVTYFDDLVLRRLE